MEYDFAWKREYSFFHSLAYVHGVRDSFKELFGKKLVVRGEGEGKWFSMLVEKGGLKALTDRFSKSILEDDGLEVIGGEDARKQFAQNAVDEKNLVVKGKTGCAGITRGVACVVKTRHDFSKFNENDVLIAVTTNVDYVPLMKKARAIVTDEGGITCHAAIVRRELNKPCIVGCKNATRVLINGDMLEVDANTGTVRVIQ